MRARRLQSWVWWLLPVLVARALLPVGFMPQDTYGRMQIVMCQGGFAQTLTVDDSALLAQAEHDKASSHWQHDFSCPFGHAAAVPMPHLVAIDVATDIFDTVLFSITAPPYEAAGPPRFIATRGPPVRT